LITYKAENMAWTTEMPRILRHMIDDLGDSPKYSDDRLQELILVAAQHVLSELNFAQTYTVDVDELILSPDPTIRSTREDEFINLTVIKAACILDRAEARRSAGQAIDVSSGSHKISVKGVLQGRISMLDKGWCKVYEDTKLEYQTSNTGIAGAAVLGPYRLFSTGQLSGGR